MAERIKGAEKIERPARAKMSLQEALEKMRKFSERRERFVATIRDE